MAVGGDVSGVDVVPKESRIGVGADWASPKLGKQFHATSFGVDCAVFVIHWATSHSILMNGYVGISAPCHGGRPYGLGDAEDADGVVWNSADVVVVPLVCVVEIVDA